MGAGITYHDILRPNPFPTSSTDKKSFDFYCLLALSVLGKVQLTGNMGQLNR